MSSEWIKKFAGGTPIQSSPDDMITLRENFFPNQTYSSALSIHD